jgi:predicted phosphodiesterase
MVNNNKKIEQVFNLIKKHPGYYKSSYGILMNITGINDKNIIKLGKNLYRSVILDKTPSLEPYLTGNQDNILIIGDTHEPFTKDGYLEFCREIQEKYNCGTVIHIGDLTDNHAISYHEKDPEGKSAGDEFNLALERCQKWYYTFPNVKICIGNHDALPFRKAFTAGLPKGWLKTYQELLKSPPTWEWDFKHIVNGIIFQHGTGLSGEMAAINTARENRQSTVIGHLHTVCNTRYLASYKDLIFGLTVGCGIDHTKYAFAYGKENSRKPVVACAVIVNGIPMNIPMPF